MNKINFLTLLREKKNENNIKILGIVTHYGFTWLAIFILVMKNWTEKTNILNYVPTIFIKVLSCLQKYIKIINQNTFQDRNNNC